MCAGVCVIERVCVSELCVCVCVRCGKCDRPHNMLAQFWIEQFVSGLTPLAAAFRFHYFFLSFMLPLSLSLSPSLFFPLSPSMRHRLFRNNTNNNNGRGFVCLPLDKWDVDRVYLPFLLCLCTPFSLPCRVGAKCCGICLHPPPPLLHTQLVFDSGPPLIKLQGVPQLASVCPVQTQGGVAGVPGSVGGEAELTHQPHILDVLDAYKEWHHNTAAQPLSMQAKNKWESGK